LNLITIATAECFTHGKVGREIHAFSRGYPLSYPWTIHPGKVPLSLAAGIFIPTVTCVRTFLQFEPLRPVEILKGIKVYTQEQDREMAVKMADAIRKITGTQIGIGTTAGIGEGGIAVSADGITLTCTSGVDADLRWSDSLTIMNRQKAGITRCLRLLEDLVTSEPSFLQDRT
jgi:uncharacterized protein (UPF0254 family)